MMLRRLAEVKKTNDVFLEQQNAKHALLRGYPLAGVQIPPTPLKKNIFTLSF